MTYNVMRGRYTCYQEMLEANEAFCSTINMESANTRINFVRNNLIMMAKHIRQYNPDIVALQEVQESPFSIALNDEISTATFLAQQLNMTLIFSPTLFDNEVQMQYGTAILLNHRRFRVASVEILSLPLGLEPRNSPCLTVQSRFDFVTFRACSIHFDHDVLNDTIRFQQSNVLINRLLRRPYYPTILLGDFNANKTSATLTNLYKYFFDDYSYDNSRPTWSECGETLKDKLDYILLDRQSFWKIKSFLHGLNMKKLCSPINMTMLSDHVPLFAETILRISLK